jgi:hypothetical protein
MEVDMKASGWGIVLTLSLTIIGCSSAPAPVPVVGAPQDLRQMTGEWGGEYQGETSGRSGSIIFQLAAGADTAYGDVVMISHQRSASRMPEQDPSAGLPMARTPDVLSIAFIRADGGGVHGRLAPYRDPDCGCELDTRFEGRIHGDVMEGTYTSRPVDGGKEQVGTWKVKRKKT